HAVPLTLVAGTGHWMMGTVDWQLLSSLLAGSLPGIFIGSYCAVRVPEKGLRLGLGRTLIVVGGELSFVGWGAPSSVAAGLYKAGTAVNPTKSASEASGFRLIAANGRRKPLPQRRPPRSRSVLTRPRPRR